MADIEYYLKKARANDAAKGVKSGTPKDPYLKKARANDAAKAKREVMQETDYVAQLPYVVKWKSGKDGKLTLYSLGTVQQESPERKQRAGVVTEKDFQRHAGLRRKYGTYENYLDNVKTYDGFTPEELNDDKLGLC